MTHLDPLLRLLLLASPVPTDLITAQTSKSAKDQICLRLETDYMYRKLQQNVRSDISFGTTGLG